MALRDKLAGLGRVAATAAADALLDWAEVGSFQKAESPSRDRRNDPIDEGQENAPGGSDAEDSNSDPVPTQKATEEPKSLLYDPFSIIEQLGYKEKPTAVTYNTLKLIMWRMPIVQAIVQTRINQVASFCKPSHNRYDLGFRVKLRDAEKEPSGADKKWSQQMETLLLRTGVTDNPRGRDDMEKFLRKLTWDSMVYDQTCHVAGTQIEMADGTSVSIEDIVVGDVVRTHSGSKKPVLETMGKPFTGKMVHISLRGQSLDVTDTHPLLVAKKISHKGNTVNLAEPTWMAAGDVTDEDYLVYPKPILGDSYVSLPIFDKAPRRYATGDIQKLADDMGLHKQTVYQMLTGTYLKNGVTPELVRVEAAKRGISYEVKHPHEDETAIDADWGKFIGLYLAGGNVRTRSGGNASSVSLTFHCDETDLIDYVISFAEKHGIKTTLVKYEDRQGTTLCLNSSRLGTFLLQHCGTGSGNKRIPEFILESPQDVRDGVLWGYLSGDGSLRTNGAVFYTTSLDLFTGLRVLLAAEGIYAGMVTRDLSGWSPKWNLQYGASLSGMEYRALASRIGLPVAEGLTTRRASISHGNFLCVKVHSIVTRDVANLPVFNMEVLDDHSYIANGFVSHNCFEIVPNRKGQPAEWYAVDASTMRLADTARTYMNEDLADAVRYVQIYDSMIVSEYTQEELAFGIRNPRTDIRLHGYGVSELEILIQVITSFLNSWDYNSKFFTQGSSAKGLLNFKGAMNETQLKAFRRHWYQMISGVENAWKTPITNAEDVQWVNMQTTNRDMEFSAWMDFLIKIACFTPDTNVTMNNGTLKRIDEVRPGDSVLTHMGRSRPVKNIQVSDFDGHLSCLRIQGGAVIRSTPEHPFLVTSAANNSWMAKDFGEPAWRLAKDIIPMRDYVVMPKPRRITEPVEFLSIKKYVEQAGGTFRDLGDTLKPESNRSNAIPSEIPLSKEVAFVLGLYAAEGSASDRSNFSWSFHEEEISYMENVECFLEKTLGLPHSRAEMPEKHCTQVRGSSVLICQALREMFGTHAPLRKIPIELMRSSSEIQQAFLSGVVGGDGCVRISGDDRSIILSIGTSSSVFAEQLRQMFLYQGVWSGIYVSNRASGFSSTGHPMNDVRVHGRPLLAISEWLGGEKGDKLRESLARFTEKTGKGTGLCSRVYYTPSYIYVPVVETWEEPYTGPVFNMEVEEDHTYQVERVAVHNCSVYSMDPVEVNFKYGNAGQKGAMQEQSNKEKITESKERGLRPLLGHLSSLINRNIIWPLNESFEFAFVGLDSFTREEAADLQTKQLKAYKMVDEIRAEEDLPPLPEGKGEVILDPTWLQYQSQQAQQQQQEQMGGDQFGGGDGQDEDGMPDFEKLLAGEDNKQDQEAQNQQQQEQNQKQNQQQNQQNQQQPGKPGQQPPQAQPGKPAQPFQKSLRQGRTIKMDFTL